MAEPDRVLLVVWMASMGGLVERQAGASLERRDLGEAGAGEWVGFMSIPSVVSVAGWWEGPGSTGRTPEVSAHLNTGTAPAS
jgi:surface antigen